jgi:hypothetical protein
MVLEILQQELVQVALSKGLAGGAVAPLGSRRAADQSAVQVFQANRNRAVEPACRRG